MQEVKADSAAVGADLSRCRSAEFDQATVHRPAGSRTSSGTEVPVPSNATVVDGRRMSCTSAWPVHFPAHPAHMNC
jgi:hypothetical protein